MGQQVFLLKVTLLGRAPADCEASINDSGIARPGLVVIVTFLIVTLHLTRKKALSGRDSLGRDRERFLVTDLTGYARTGTTKDVRRKFSYLIAFRSIQKILGKLCSLPTS